MVKVCRHALEAWRQVCSDLDIEHAETVLLTDTAGVDGVPLGEFVAMLESTAARYDGAPLGWVAGERFPFRLMGEVGNAILSSLTLGTALKRFVDYFGLMQDATEFDMRVAEGMVVVRYRILDPAIWPRRQDALFTLSIVGQLLRRARGFDWQSVQIALESEDPVLAAGLRQRTGLTCIEEAEINVIRFPAAALALPMANGDAVIAPDYKALNRDLARRRRAMSVRLRVETEVYRLLGVGLLDQERIAGRLGMSTRTLRRRLADEKRSFQEIVHDCRMQRATHEFRCRRDVSIAHTALRLGYSEHSAFTRAFTRWNGVPPNAFLRMQVAD